MLSSSSLTPSTWRRNSLGTIWLAFGFSCAFPDILPRSCVGLREKRRGATGRGEMRRKVRQSRVWMDSFPRWARTFSQVISLITGQDPITGQEGQAT